MSAAAASRTVLNGEPLCWDRMMAWAIGDNAGSSSQEDQAECGSAPMSVAVMTARRRARTGSPMARATTLIASGTVAPAAMAVASKSATTGACAHSEPLASWCCSRRLRRVRRVGGTFDAGWPRIDSMRFVLGELSHSATAAEMITALRRPTLLHQAPLYSLNDASCPHRSDDRQSQRHREDQRTRRRAKEPRDRIGAEQVAHGHPDKG